MKINQFDVRKGDKVETVLVVPYNTEKNIKEISQKHLQEADEVIVTIWKYGKKIDVQSFVNEVEAVTEQAEEKPEKKVKYTATQQKVVDAVENAVIYYLPRDEHITGIMSKLYIDGERVLYNEDDSRKNVAYMISENKFSLELSTATIKALSKKGFFVELEDMEVNGKGLDVLTTTKNYEMPKIYDELVELTFEEEVLNTYTNNISKYTSYAFCPVGQEELVLSNEKFKNATLKKSYTFAVKHHKF